MINLAIFVIGGSTCVQQFANERRGHCALLCQSPGIDAGHEDRDGGGERSSETVIWETTASGTWSWR